MLRNTKKLVKYSIILYLLAIIGAYAVLGHDWYPSECCSEYDCMAITCNQLSQGIGKQIHWKDLMVFQEHMVKVSPDNLCHVCFGEQSLEINNQVTKQFTPHCVFIQNKGF